jgi:hypothetical protein
MSVAHGNNSGLSGYAEVFPGMDIHEAITESQTTCDNEAIVRNAYHTAEGTVLDIPGWIGSFTEDGVFSNVSGEASYRGEHLQV